MFLLILQQLIGSMVCGSDLACAELVVTDEQGMFHIEGVKPGSHVVQMDLDTLAPQYEPVICDEHSRFAGRAFSRFVDLQAGTLWRTDFHVKAAPPPKAEVELSLNSSVDDHIATYHLGMKGGDIALDNMRLMVNIPETTRYIPGTSVLDNRVIEDPEISGPFLIYKLCKVQGTWARQLNFLAEMEVNGQTTVLPSKAFMMFNSPSKKNLRTHTPIIPRCMIASTFNCVHSLLNDIIACNVIATGSCR